MTAYARFTQYGGRLALPLAAEAELKFGIQKFRAVGGKEADIKRAERRLQDFLARIDLAPIPAELTDVYAKLRATLETQGKPIGPNDYWIAAQALALDAILVTDNLSEFERLEGLRLDNWLG